VLDGVAAVGSGAAWAVGATIAEPARTLILRWDGTAWRTVASPDPSAGSDVLDRVAAVSARSAWAVGFSSGGRPVVATWTGTAWVSALGGR